MIRNIALPIVIVFSFTLAALLAPAFFDPFSLALTLGGAVGVTCLSYSRKQLRDLLLAICALIVEREPSLQDHIDELRRLTALFRLQGLKGLENQESHLDDLFLRQGVELLVDLQNEQTIRARLEQRFNCFLAACEINRQILATLGKLLPSFGLIGTLIGMVLLLSNLSHQDSHALPSALGLAVLTTLYGAVAANVLVAPLAARLQSMAVEREAKMRLTKNWVMMVFHGEAASIANRLTFALPVAEADINEPKHWLPIGMPIER